MKKQKNLQIATLAVLAFAVLFMAIGFAAYAQTLKISGTVNVKKSAWSVHWDTDKFTLEDDSEEVTHTQFTDTQLTFQCTLPEPGKYCAFTIDAINEGTYDAKLSSIDMGITGDADYANYLTYKIYYNNATTPYTQSTSNITGITLSKASGDPAVAGRHPVLVRVDYVAPNNETGEGLPTTDKTITVTANFHYDQVTTN
ncbi:hypothetical protein IJ102_00790 [Candidatus Saccharibacteria bacterium]|nr:hypothetical protein [Candidatus Saccharibacteria bacterium]